MARSALASELGHTQTWESRASGYYASRHSLMRCHKKECKAVVVGKVAKEP